MAWIWLLVPLAVMAVGSNLVFGVFYAATGSLAQAARRTLAVGPLTWSVLHLLLLWLAIVRLRRRGVSLSSLVGYSRALLTRDLGAGLALAFSCSSAILGIQHFQRGVFAGGALPWPTPVLVYWTLVTSLTAGLGEEAYFRGFLFERMAHRSAAFRIVVTSLAFAAWHVAPNMLAHTFAVGLMFGATYVWFGRLFPVMVAHALTDVIGGVGMLAGWW